MDVNVAEVAAEVVPYVTAAVRAYGGQTLARVRDAAVEEATDATVGLGQRCCTGCSGRLSRGRRSRPR